MSDDREILGASFWDDLRSTIRQDFKDHQEWTEQFLAQAHEKNSSALTLDTGLDRCVNTLPINLSQISIGHEKSQMNQPLSLSWGQNYASVGPQPSQVQPLGIQKASRGYFASSSIPASLNLSSEELLELYRERFQHWIDFFKSSRQKKRKKNQSTLHYQTYLRVHFFELWTIWKINRAHEYNRIDALKSKVAQSRVMKYFSCWKLKQKVLIQFRAHFQILQQARQHYCWTKWLQFHIQHQKIWYCQQTYCRKIIKQGLVHWKRRVKVSNVQHRFTRRAMKYYLQRKISLWHDHTKEQQYFQARLSHLQQWKRERFIQSWITYMQEKRKSHSATHHFHEHLQTQSWLRWKAYRMNRKQKHVRYLHVEEYYHFQLLAQRWTRWKACTLQGARAQDRAWQWYNLRYIQGRIFRSYLRWKRSQAQALVQFTQHWTYRKIFGRWKLQTRAQQHEAQKMNQLHVARQLSRVKLYWQKWILQYQARKRAMLFQLHNHRRVQRSIWTHWRTFVAMSRRKVETWVVAIKHDQRSCRHAFFHLFKNVTLEQQTRRRHVAQHQLYQKHFVQSGVMSHWASWTVDRQREARQNREAQEMHRGHVLGFFMHSWIKWMKKTQQYHRLVFEQINVRHERTMRSQTYHAWVLMASDLLTLKRLSREWVAQQTLIRKFKGVQKWINFQRRQERQHALQAQADLSSDLRQRRLVFRQWKRSVRGLVESRWTRVQDHWQRLRMTRWKTIWTSWTRWTKKRRKIKALGQHVMFSRSRCQCLLVWTMWTRRWSHKRFQLEQVDTLEKRQHQTRQYMILQQWKAWKDGCILRERNIREVRCIGRSRVLIQSLRHWHRTSDIRGHVRHVASILVHQSQFRQVSRVWNVWTTRVHTRLHMQQVVHTVFRKYRRKCLWFQWKILHHDAVVSLVFHERAIRYYHVSICLKHAWHEWQELLHQRTREWQASEHYHLCLLSRVFHVGWKSYLEARHVTKTHKQLAQDHRMFQLKRQAVRDWKRETLSRHELKHMIFYRWRNYRDQISNERIRLVQTQDIIATCVLRRRWSQWQLKCRARHQAQSIQHLVCKYQMVLHFWTRWCAVIALEQLKEQLDVVHLTRHWKGWIQVTLDQRLVRQHNLQAKAFHLTLVQRRVWTQLHLVSRAGHHARELQHVLRPRRLKHRYWHRWTDRWLERNQRLAILQIQYTRPAFKCWNQALVQWNVLYQLENHANQLEHMSRHFGQWKAQVRLGYENQIQAQKYHHQRLVQSVVFMWHGRTLVSVKKRQLEHKLERNTRHQVWTIWIQRFTTCVRARHWEHRRTLAKSWATWRVFRFDQMQVEESKQWYHNHLILRQWTHWQRHVSSRRHVQAFVRTHELRIQHRGFRVWKCWTRWNLNVMDYCDNPQSSVEETCVDDFAHRQTQLDQAFHSWRNMHLFLLDFRAFTTHVDRRLSCPVVQWLDPTLGQKIKCLLLWQNFQARRTQRRHVEYAAMLMWYQHTQRRVFRGWKKSLDDRRVTNASVVQEVFHSWRLASQRQRRLQHQFHSFLQLSQIHLTSCS